MNKKINTLLFILGATLFNIIVALITFVLLMVLYVRLIMDFLPETSRSWGFTIIFIIAIVVSFVAYRFMIKFLLKKVELDKYFDPLFVRRNIRKSQ